MILERMVCGARLRPLQYFPILAFAFYCAHLPSFALYCTFLHPIVFRATTSGNSKKLRERERERKNWERERESFMRRFPQKPKGIFVQTTFRVNFAGDFWCFLGGLLFLQKARGKNSPKIHRKIQIATWELRGQNPQTARISAFDRVIRVVLGSFGLKDSCRRQNGLGGFQSPRGLIIRQTKPS